MVCRFFCPTEDTEEKILFMEPMDYIGLLIGLAALLVCFCH